MLALPSDAEATRMIIHVVMIGSVIIILATGTLLLFFRSFDERKKRADNFRLVWMLAITLAVVVAFSMVLFRLSFTRG
jgi:uncharacterized membrane protein YidH (DUF202 family)